MAIIETERLSLREFTADDAAFILELLNSPGWLQFIGDRNIKNLTDAERYIEATLQKSYKTNGFGFYAIWLKDEEKPIGMSGLVKRDFLEVMDVGFAMLPEFTNKGYAVEAAAATLNFAKTNLNVNRLGAIALPANSRSITLLQKLGFSFQEMVKSNGEELSLFMKELE